MSAGKDFFELKGYSIFDLMGTVFWPDLEPHYDHITPYLGKTNQRFREVEIVAVTKDFGYITAVQRVDGKLLMVNPMISRFVPHHFCERLMEANGNTFMSTTPFQLTWRRR